MNFVSAKQSPEESQEEEMEMFKKLYIEWKGEDQSIDPQYKVIPRFYFKVHIFDYVKTHILVLYFKVSFVMCMLSWEHSVSEMAYIVIWWKSMVKLLVASFAAMPKLIIATEIL